ncbi:MAG: beta-glucosidase [Candidatus Obscuribacterales bacterium]|nr:beta-glucosidase [Candidatus Obscuribacterales bacterium]
MNSTQLSFPPHFLWGAATASYQIEGAWNEGGKGESIWDRFSHTPGKVRDGDTGDIACDHYHRFAEDIKLMRDMGIKAYRFSISWPRVIPNGSGPVNWVGLDFYDRVVDALLVAGIEPWVTLYHWDLPQALQDKGGWTNRDVLGYFADYAACMTRRLGDRVHNWMTINEPWVISFLGNNTGEHAPGIKDEKITLQVAHNLMVGHGMAVQAIRADQPKSKVGIVFSLSPAEAETHSPGDMRAAQMSWETGSGWFLDPILKAHYPTGAWSAYGANVPDVKPGDFALTSQKLDFVGVNYYFRTLVNEKGNVEQIKGSEYTEMGWEVHAPSLRGLLNRMKSEYQLPPVYITENGAAFKDEVSADGQVHDPRRLNFIKDHLTAVRDAINDGVDVRGYFVWSLMDNFEWAHGFSKRFGVTHVDYKTLKRTVKDSGKWYAKVIKANAIVDAAQLATVKETSPARSDYR